MEDCSAEDEDEAPEGKQSPELSKMDQQTSLDITLEPPTPGTDDRKELSRLESNNGGRDQQDREVNPRSVGGNSEEELPPPLPPRPSRLKSSAGPASSPLDTLQRSRKSKRPQLQSTATTAVSLTDIHTQLHQDGLRGTYSTPTKSKQFDASGSLYQGNSLHASRNGSDAGDTSSIRSYAPTLEAGGDVESLLGEVLGDNQESPAWKLLGGHTEMPDPFELLTLDDKYLEGEFEQEFEEVGELSSDGSNEGERA